ncbi:sensor domain-containing diguanylate cyclase [Pseudocolwellia sp. HL-MZ19]|uniref:sensor domain-containing diguanylate cyclase n=1 Tax=Pseudocolwellia sp. HL-MZ19 TaxID=3400846 RepID=UPI003CF40D52
MAQNTFVRDWELKGKDGPGGIIKYLNEIQIKYKMITSYFTSDKNLNYYHPNGVIEKISKENKADSWYFSLKNTPESQMYEIAIDYDTSNANKITIFINHKVYDYNDNFIGATGVGLALDTVENLIANYQNRYHRTIYFIDKEGKIVLKGGQFNHSSTLSDRLKNKKLTQSVLNTTSNTIDYTHAGKKIYLNSRYIKEFDWFLIVEQDAINSEEELTNTFIINIFLSLFVTIGVLFIAHLAFNNYQKNLVTMASIDKLSGLLNRQAFEPIILNNIEQSKRNQTHLSLMMLDIDFFKKVNDTYRHLTGDKVIKYISQICKSHVRESDAVCRWGGEEFIIMLADTSLDGAKNIAQRIQETLSKTTVEPKVTISLGITVYQPDESLNSFIVRANDALYEAKHNGRNCIKIKK